MNFMNPASFMEPRHLCAPAPWAGHIPFAFWLIPVLQPQTFVELGAYSGISYLAFCQSIRHHQLATRAFAVDTWEGDAHAGVYDNSIYEGLRKAHDPQYSEFSTLLRMTFDDALPRFADGSVDLLHIDGLHTYEAVRHDFETWLPKMSSRGVVLFHDTAVYRDDFGVHQLWAEIAPRYPSFEFAHSNGLGVLLVGAQQPPELLAMCENLAGQDEIRHFFAALGGRFERQVEILSLETTLRDAHEREVALTQAGELRHQWIEQQDQTILDLQRRLEQAAQHIEQQDQTVLDQQRRLEQAAQHIEQQDQTVLDQQCRLERARETIEQLNAQQAATHQQLTAAQQTLQQVYGSRSWRATAGLRAAGRLARRLGGTRAVAWTRRVRNAMRYAMRGDWQGAIARARVLRQEAIRSRAAASGEGAVRRVGVMATPHTMFVAHLIANALEKADMHVEICDQPPTQFPLDTYVVICPQMFTHLPPGEKRIAFQMEQSVSSRWFTPEYLKLLENSLAVLDYAQTNLAFLEGKGIAYPHTYLVPIGGLSDYGGYLAAHGQQMPGCDEPCDVLFYGDVNAPRRKAMLQALRERFNLRVEGDLFGPALRRAVASARVVVNLHYYEGALLETTRIYECLSLGVPVVSESSADMEEHARLADAVHFFPVGDTRAMMSAIAEILDQTGNAEQFALRQAAIAHAVEASEQHFLFMLYRALYALRIMDHGAWERLTQPMALSGRQLALSLPETPIRRSAFLQARPAGVEVFDGIRQTPGWIGCALSYKYLGQKALQAGWPRLEVMEDDVLFPPDYSRRRSLVDAHLAEREGQWDVFAGLIAIVHPDTRILRVERRDDMVFVTLDRMISMVHNIYAPAALQMLAQWNPANVDPHTNTIDRHLQNCGHLRVITTLPFLVGHHEELHSSLWGVQNSHYSELIARAEAQLAAKVQAFESEALGEARG